MYERGRSKVVRIRRPADLIHWTYFMVDWAKASQGRSGQRCVQCGGEMNSVEPAIDDAGNRYEGLVCHGCKRLIWMKA